MARLKYFKHATRTSTLAPLLLISAKITITDDRRGQQPRGETCESTTCEKQRVRNVVRYDTKGGTAFPTRCSRTVTETLRPRRSNGTRIQR